MGIDLSSNMEKHNEILEELSHALRDQSTQTIIFHQTLAEHLGLNATDHKCLEIISRTGPITAGRLAELTGLTTGAVTGVIDRLEKVGFVQRGKDPNDRRRVIIEPLLEKAKVEFEPLFSSFRERMNKLCSCYNHDELRIVLDFVLQSMEILREETDKLRSKSK